MAGARESSGSCLDRPVRSGRRSCAITSVRWFRLNFFTVPAITGEVLFVSIILEHRRREVVPCNVRDQPAAAWASQQIVTALNEHDTSRYLLRDQDGVYGERHSVAYRFLS